MNIFTVGVAWIQHAAGWPPIVPQFITDGANSWSVPDDMYYGVWSLDDGIVGVLFVLVPDETSVSVQAGDSNTGPPTPAVPYTLASSDVIPNANTIGDLRLDVFTLVGPSTLDSAIVTLTGDVGSTGLTVWSIIYAQTPVTPATTVLSEVATSPHTFGHTVGPVLGAVASVGTGSGALANASISYPTSGTSISSNFLSGLDTTRGDLTVFASDDAGDFTATQSFMKHVVLVGDP